MNQISALLPTWLPAPFRGTRAHVGAFDVALGLMTMVLMATSLAPTTLMGQEPAVVEQDSAALAQDSLDVPEEVEQVTDERAAQDEAIRNQLQAVFDRVPDLAGVEVTVDAGVVHLEGTVLRSETRTRAGELAAEMDGVLFLDNRIQESTSLDVDLIRVKSEAIRSVKETLEAEGLTLPSPEYMIRVRKDTPRPAPSPATPIEPADVSVDAALDRQIEEDRRATSEPDLLDASRTDPKLP